MLIDKKDLKILTELDKNSRITYTALGKEVLLSKQAVKQRLNKLVNDKFITEFVTLINTKSMGYSPYLIFLSLYNCASGKKEQLVEYLKKKPGVTTISICDGTHDIYFGYIAKSNEELDHFLSGLYSDFSSQIHSKKIIQLIDSRYYERNYLLKSKRNLAAKDRGFHKRGTDILSLKELDFKILFHLGQDSRKNLLQIAQEEKVTVQTIINRIKFLEKNEVIKGYTILINDQKIVSHAILLEFNSIPLELEQQLYHYCQSCPNIIFAAKAFGEYDFMMNTEAFELSDYRKIIDDLKKNFHASLHSITPLLLMESPKLNFFPKKIN